MILLLYSFTVPPELSISATSTRIAIGQSTNLTCTISRSVPIDPTIEWTMTDSNNITTTLNETGMTLMIINITEDEFGDYTCTAINSAGLSGSDNITIEQGCKLHLIYIFTVCDCGIVIYADIPVVSITDEIDPLIPGDNVTLTCSATGDTPFTYQWTIEGNNTDILNTNTSSGILTLTNIVESDFGTYTCEVFNAMGNDAESIVLEQASKLLFFASHFSISLCS